MQREIYLDHNATTPMAPEVLEAMLPWLRDRHGNPSCGHRLGQEARKAVDEVRQQFVSFFGCGSDEVVFTSGGTESNNMAIKGAAWALEKKGRHVVVGASEHPSVLDAARFLTRSGFEVTEVAPDSTGQVGPAALRAALREDTVLVSIMNAQNVVGTINRVDELAETALAGRGICFHVDAAQSAGKIPTAFPFFGCDLMTIAGHKLYGPKGVGALIVRRGLVLEPLLHGAGHEKGRRSGTENVAGIVGLGAALKLAQRTMAEAGERLVALRDALHLRLADGLTGVKLNGHPLDRLPNTLHLSFLGVTGKAIAERCPGLLIATGPACHDRAADLPPALKAMNMDPQRASGALRLSLGKGTTWDEVEEAADRIVAAVEALRAEAPSLPASANAPSDRPTCPRCEQHPLRLELIGVAPAVVCARHPTCRYEAYLALPAGAA